MNRNEAIERAAQAIIDKLDSRTGAGTTLGFRALREALAMPKPVQPIIQSQQYNDEVYRDGA